VHGAHVGHRWRAQPLVGERTAEQQTAEPAYTRLDVDERRRRLLELGRELFAQHSYQELSMARIAREAGISKALLYHYFPSQQDYFAATLTTAAELLRELTEPDPSLPPIEALSSSLDAYLRWIEHQDYSRDELRNLLLGTLFGALGSAGAAELLQ
jgi:AcrR family transcriptional regulator